MKPDIYAALVAIGVIALGLLAACVSFRRREGSWT
jgi:hypothetical protein